MSGDQAENESESSLPTFRPFTREELAIIENRITEKKLAAKKKEERRARNIAVRFDSISLGRQGPAVKVGGCLLIFFEVCLLHVELLVNTYLVTLIKYHFFKKKTSMK